LRSAKDVLRLAIRHGGTTLINFTDFHGRPGNFRRKLRVYGRTGEPCRACGTPLARTIVGGRSTHFCPTCQRR
jgi:formamidopyrimidine-DNA glycosylase